MSALRERTDMTRDARSAHDLSGHCFLRRHNVKVGGHLAAHSSAILGTLVRASSKRGRHCPRSAGRAIKDDYFGVPTNRAPVNLPSSPMSGA